MYGLWSGIWHATYWNTVFVYAVICIKKILRMHEVHIASDGVFCITWNNRCLNKVNAIKIYFILGPAVSFVPTSGLRLIFFVN